MKTRYIISRYMAILGRLSNGKKANFSEIQNYIENQGIQNEKTFSKRTFQRIIQDIEFIFHITIKCDKDGYYYIASDQSEGSFDRASQALHLLNYQKHIENFDHFISYDAVCSKGQKYFYDIQNAIKNSIVLEIQYKKYELQNSQIEKREIAPYGLKESNGRWYLVGQDMAIKAIRVFGLDRIEELTESNKKFRQPKDFNINQYFKHSVGVYLDPDGISEIIYLKFTHMAGYIKNFPLHHSQTIDTETPDYIVVKLRCYVNTDLINLLMTYSDDVEVLRPESLKKKLKDRVDQFLIHNP